MPMQNELPKQGLSIDPRELAAMREDFFADRANRSAMRAVTNAGLAAAARDPLTVGQQRHHFSVNVKQGKITNQKQSGRCWMFAALNTMRFAVMQRFNLETFEFSQNYPLFYDKLEKANSFLENILATLDEQTDSRLIAHLLSEPMGDGGQWDMFCALIEKYGAVPKDVMPETSCSSATREMDRVLTHKLREYACVLRSAHSDGQDAESLRAQKRAMLGEVYRILAICLGVPPQVFTFEARDCDDNFIRQSDVTPQEFFRNSVGWDLSDYVSLINAPTADKPYFRTYGVKFLSSVYEGRPVRYLNLPIEQLKEAAIKQLKDGCPVWFGCDVGQASIREGVMDPDVLRYDELLGVKFTLDRGQRLEYHQSLMTHAMVLLGVNLDEDGHPTRWRVENSWGKDAGADGYYVMSDEWFDEYLYQIVVDKKYLPRETAALLSQEPIMLEPWDPMGSLALV